jgi:hypothetical protein
MKTRRTMKTIFCSCMMAGILLSCGKDEAVGPASNFLPKTVGVYFQLRDANNKMDLFNSNELYTIESLKVYRYNRNNKLYEDTVTRYEQREDKIILRTSFGLIYLGGAENSYNPRIDYLFRFNETDHDTLTIVPTISRVYLEKLEGVFNSPYSTRLDRLQVFYNGELINDWNLKDDEELRSRILGSDDPPINVIYKKAEKRLD